MFKDIYDSSEEREVFFSVDDANLYRLDEGILFTEWEIWTGKDKTGTQLTDGVDYLVGAKSDRATQVKGDDVYQGFQILTSTYRDVALFATLTWVGNIGDTDVIRPQTDYYGDRIESGDVLLYNSTFNLNTSEGAEPLSSQVKIVDSKIEIDGVLYDNEAVKWPSQRMGAFCGAERENLIVNGNDAGSWTDSGTAVSAQAGDWVETDNGATPSTGYTYLTVTLTGAFLAVISGTIKNVSGATSTRVITSGGYGVDITWATKTVTLRGAGTAVIQDDFLTDDVVVFSCSIDDVSASRQIRIYPDISNAGAVVQFKDMMAVDFASETPHWLPYFEGVLPEVRYVEPLNYTEAFTISFWVKCDWELGEDHTFFSNRLDEDANRIFCRYDSSDKIRLTFNNESGTSFNYFSTAFSSALTGWNHFKICVDTTDESNTYIFANGVDITDSRNVVSGTYSLNPYLCIGADVLYSSPASDPLNSLIQDIHFRPSVDTTTTHYDSGLPWIDADATTSEDGSIHEGKGVQTARTFYDKDGIMGGYEKVWEGDEVATVANKWGVGNYILIANLVTGGTLYGSFHLRVWKLGVSTRAPSFISTTNNANYAQANHNSSNDFVIAGSGTYTTGGFFEIWKERG